MILGIETSGLLFSIAWYNSDRIFLEYNIEKDQVHATLIADFFERGMNYLKLKPKDISLAAISSGPGSFTGLRIGMSFIKGLCFGADIPVVGVSNFNVLALQACTIDSPFTALINANKERFYYARFNKKDNDYYDSGILQIEDISQNFDKQTGLIIDYYTKINLIAKPWRDFRWILHGRYNATYLCQAAEIKYAKNGADDINNLEPEYLQAFAGVL